MTQNTSHFFCSMAVVYTFLGEFYITYLAVFILH